MSSPYFEKIITEARRRFPIHYISCAINIPHEGEWEYSVHLTLVEGTHPRSDMKKGGEMVHVMNSKQSLAATIEEAVRRADFEMGRIPALIEHEDLPLLTIDAAVDEIRATINEGGPAGDST